MNNEAIARLRSHRQNIKRYRALLHTKLTMLERDFVERRIIEEESAVKAVAPDTFASASMPCGAPPPDAG